MVETKPVLFELGVEEMPSAPLINAERQFAKLIEEGLKQLSLTFDALEVISSPRRLAILIQNLATSTPEVHETLRGPKTSIAFDEAGNPTRAAQGFAKKLGLRADELVRRCDSDGHEYVFAERHLAARPALPLLKELFEQTIHQLEWPNYRSQRWGTTKESFVRPVRWICALLGAEIIPVEFAGLCAGDVTYGHRVLGPGAHKVSSPEAYLSVLEAASVYPASVRAERIRAGIAEIERALQVRVDTPQRVFDEVVNLCECPDVLVGHFDESFLEVPHEIICESMLSNQRYFPCYDLDGNLSSAFVIVSNADPTVAPTVIDGNERVVRARLSDAQFFYEEDLKVSLDSFRERLHRVGFHQKLGSVLAKSERIEDLTLALTHEARVGAKVAAAAARAAHLCKADLVSNAVVEFTSQQGVMGAYYALAAGEGEDVAEGIRDQYRPRFAGDELPAGLCGALVAVADKLDTIVGMFVIGEPPTGSKDPYALRRAAIGVIHIMRERFAIDLKPLIQASLESYSAQGITCDIAATEAELMQFFLGRMQQIARDEGIAADTVAAVSTISLLNPQDYFARAHALEDARAHDGQGFNDLATAFARAAHLANADLGINVDMQLCTPAEHALMQAIEGAETRLNECLHAKDYVAALSCLSELREPIDAFFDAVMVMDEDEAIRSNRLRLLNRFTSLFTGIANLAEMGKRA
ncbi:glycine--tRNA ligase subunit beta [Collinsella sp. zg1085]|uniref:glycine--tRNA ligase subunit beta n=1 Tax=Collinsella sp. zg1085 TaxID=2844380 RepID=UPI001C0C78D0|nr:glycine--tRNA ligase subunit beta [Collinsella sp. zg1085]QWT17046.1 glycine--tRNA ligase subunit beta [Collinsella sp. zg1085]